MSTLVTGAAGFIGSHLCEALLEAGHHVVGLDSFDDFYPPEVKERNLERARTHDAFALVRGDIRDPDALDGLPDDVERVVHLAARAAGRASLAQPALYADVNVTGTARVLEWMRARRIGSLAFASSSSVYGDVPGTPFRESEPLGAPRSPYGATKRAGELLCHAAAEREGLGVAALRFFTVYGPRQRPDLAIHKFARILRCGGAIPVYGDGRSSRDYTYVDDVVGAVTGALRWGAEHEGRFRTFNVGNDRTVVLSDMVEALARALSVTPTIEWKEAHPGDLPHTRADIARARAELGYAPVTDFETGVERFVAWFDAVGS